MATQLGKRYLCDTCGTEILCNKPGTGSITCCDHEMKVKEAKPLPSSDRIVPTGCSRTRGS